MQPVPGGAQCALHAGVPAQVVCARCGNFMCTICSVNGTEAQCPTCRDLRPVAFPYDASADLGTLWNHVTTSFQREMAMCIVATIIFFALAMGGGLVANVISAIINAIFDVKMDPSNPLRDVRGLILSQGISQLIAMVVNLVVQGVALVGLYRVLIDVLVGKKADLARMFSQLHLLPRYLVMQLILFVGITVPILVYFGGVAFVSLRLIGLDWRHLDRFRPEQLVNPGFIGLLFASSLLVIAVSVVVLPVTLFSVPELVVGQCEPVEAIKRAWTLGDGQRLRTLGYSLVAGLVVLAGFIACCVGMLFALPVSYMLLLSLFLALRQSSSLPPAVHT